MVILRIEHPISDFIGWKKAFDSDPLGRRKAGVRRYRILRPVDDPHAVTLDLEFDTRAEAERLLPALRALWARVEGKIMTDPLVRVFDVVELVEY